MDVNDAGALRQWLRGCPELDGRRSFGVDWLSDVPGSWALCSAAPPAERRNILGGRLPGSGEYRLALRAPADGGAQALERLRRVSEWIGRQDGPVRADPAGALCRSDGATARWEMRIWAEESGTGN